MDAFATAIVLLEVRMRRSGPRWLDAAKHGWRRATALAAAAAAATAVAGCQAATAGAAAGRSSASAAARATAGPSSASAAAGPVTSPPVPGPSPRIMIVGDSVTQGSSGDYTWQYRLYEHLRADGVSPRMVGPHHTLFNNVTKVDGDHSYERLTEN